jgi:magnesium transporter
MSIDSAIAIAALNRRYLLDYPREAARRIEALPLNGAAEVLAGQPVSVIVPVWEQLSAEAEESLLPLLSETLRRGLLRELSPTHAALLLNRMDTGLRGVYLDTLEPQIAAELRMLMSYPKDTAGELMDPRVMSFPQDLSAHEALQRLRAGKQRALRELFLIDAERRLTGRVDLQDLALADPDQSMSTLARPVPVAVTDTAPREEVVDDMENFPITDLPVVDFSGRLIGVIRPSALVTAVQEEATLDIQTMVGVSKDERALSDVRFSVLKRLPWLQINLLTAFLAASVVGLFEDTIARFTALAVLLPVVAGQSGNAGAQALAVTMRGLALREIGVRHWPQVLAKEVNVGLLNGLAIALTTALGVLVWSRSFGLALIIALAMVLSMIAAGFAGAVIPITLRRMGQDPAQSSSILLTTVTDVVGFMSFLGIATMLSGLLEKSA